MATLLRIDSSPLNGDRSTSRQLTSAFVAKWQALHPDGKVITRDLADTNLSPVTAEWIAAAYTPESGLTSEQRQVMALSNELIAELQAADEYVIGVPMYNFSIPAVVKLWIDQVARAGKTFAYASGGVTGLLQEKKATFLIASGGVYDLGTPAGAMNFVEPYLRTVFAFLGVTDSHFITAGGTARLRGGIDRETLLRPALASIHSHLATAPETGTMATGG
jgi:FMN-dependent NADH-azoreductase